MRFGCYAYFVPKKEELYRKDHPSDRAFQASIASYIEFYNNKRPHRTLKNLTPYQMEENFCATVK
ncbi:MAG: IS3 family transposase [Oscillospiraceae bacterium]